MPGSDLSPALKRFLKEFVHTYDELEILLLLCSRRTHFLSSGEIGDAVKLASEAVAAALDSLHTAGIVERSPSDPSAYRYPAQSPFDAELVELRASYAESRIPIVQLMSQNALDRVKSSAFHTFAEAFRLRGRKKDG